MDKLDLNIIHNAFPKRFKSDIDELASILHSSVNVPYISVDNFEILVESESLVIPYRIYINEANIKWGNLTSVQQSIMYCLLTRSSNGFVREKYLINLLKFHESWIAPYIVQLIGEYVYEVIVSLYENLDLEWLGLVKKFALENPEYYYKTKSRLVSYWNCYFRDSNPIFSDYIGGKLLSKIDKHSI